jgi:hypothetical protein
MLPSGQVSVLVISIFLCAQRSLSQDKCLFKDIFGQFSEHTNFGGKVRGRELLFFSFNKCCSLLREYKA